MQMHKKVFYINGIESAASAMEGASIIMNIRIITFFLILSIEALKYLISFLGSALSARNIALLIASQETHHGDTSVLTEQRPIPALPHLEKIFANEYVQYFVLFTTGAYYGSIYSAMDVRAANSPRDFFAIIQFVLTSYVVGFWTEYIISFLVPFTAELHPRELAVMSGGEFIAGILVGLGMILSREYHLFELISLNMAIFWHRSRAADVVTPAALVLKIKYVANQTRRTNAVLTLLGVIAALVFCVTARESLLSFVSVVS